MTRIPFPEHAWPLLRRALEHIQAHPDEFWMDRYLVTSDDPYGNVDDYERATGRPFPSCGTVACLAGRILLEDGADPRRLGVFDGGHAVQALGLPVSSQGSILLFPDDEVGAALMDVFQDTTIADYADLCAELRLRFTFPEPLPTVPAGDS